MGKQTQVQHLEVRFERSGEGAFVLTLAGEWTRAAMRANDEWQALFQRIPNSVGAAGGLGFDCRALNRWDMRLVAALAGMLKSCNDLGCELDLSGLPEGIRGLFDLAAAVPEAEGRGSEGGRDGWMENLGHHAIAVVQGFWNYNAFLGELILELLATMRGKTSMRARDFWLAIQNAGPMAVPITSLLAFLTGLIIAYIGVLQLHKLAADIFVADLVGLVMTRELAAVMTGVIMAGRTGAAYAAQIGSMRVNDEIDALKSFGISPVRFLVVPKVLALVLMMPLLVALANVVSIFAGMLVAVGISDVTLPQYHFQIVNAVGMNDVLVGLFKSLVFGFIIALAGCYRGLRCGRDAAAVGQATTSAVVTAITWIVIVDAIFAVSLNILGI
jgi:phospholipid/cholesterol/gamma-HCH transport system permease protein